MNDDEAQRINRREEHRRRRQADARQVLKMFIAPISLLLVDGAFWDRWTTADATIAILITFLVPLGITLFLAIRHEWSSE
jgi:hypothetical protein